MEKWGWEGHSRPRLRQVQRAPGAFGKGVGHLEMNGKGVGATDI